jgi:hypothetical protein
MLNWTNSKLRFSHKFQLPGRQEYLAAQQVSMTDIRHVLVIENDRVLIALEQWPNEMYDVVSQCILFALGNPNRGI